MNSDSRATWVAATKSKSHEPMLDNPPGVQDEVVEAESPPATTNVLTSIS